MDEIEDGGPAFPKPGTDECIDVCGSQRGMSLRDWLAGQALPAIIAEYHTDLRSDGMSIQLTADDHSIEIAHEAYAMADAMLAARKKVRE
jgi:hypothetical protein